MLILDNLEQIIDVGPAITDLLERLPDLSALATSRTPLRIRAEHRLAVDSLPIPSDEVSEDELPRNPAVETFSELAQIREHIDPETLHRECDAGSLADLDAALETALATLDAVLATARDKREAG